jgi:hypothetical protein
MAPKRRGELIQEKSYTTVTNQPYFGGFHLPFFREALSRSVVEPLRALSDEALGINNGEFTFRRNGGIYAQSADHIG